jgi:phosphoserine phosphatase
MSTSADAEQYTGLILLSGVDKPGITKSLFEVLSPFAITIVDIEQVVIKDRLILTVLIALNPAHEEAISADLESCAASLDVDITTLFSYEEKSSLSTKSNLAHVTISCEKINPKAISEMAEVLHQSGANIERITRLASNPSTAIEFILSGAKTDTLSQALSPIALSNGLEISIGKI